MCLTLVCSLPIPSPFFCLRTQCDLKDIIHSIRFEIFGRAPSPALSLTSLFRLGNPALRQSSYRPECTASLPHPSTSSRRGRKLETRTRSSKLPERDSSGKSPGALSNYEVYDADVYSWTKLSCCNSTSISSSKGRLNASVHKASLNQHFLII